MAEQRIVAVAGATGFVGRHIVRALQDRGWTVRALIRDADKAAKVFNEHRGALPDVVQGEATDPAALSRLLAGAAACVNAIGILREGHGQTFRAAHVQVPRALVKASREAGVPRLVHVSALGVREDAPTAYLRTKYDGEQIVRRSDLSWTILRPSMIHGPDGEMMQTVKGWVRGEAQPWFFLPYFTRGELSSDVPLAAINQIDPKVAPVAVEDVAAAVAAALERGEASGEIYPLAGPETLSWPALLRFVRDTIPGGRDDLEPRGVPAARAAIAAKVARALGVGALLPFDEGMALMASEDSTPSIAKARSHLGFDPRPFRMAFRSYATRV